MSNKIYKYEKLVKGPGWLPLTGKKYLFAMIIGSWLLAASCTKNDHIDGTASLTMFNAIAGVDRAYTNFGATQALQWFKDGRVLDFGRVSNYNGMAATNLQFNTYSGDQQIMLFKYPDTTAHHKPVIDLRVSLPVGTINSLFFLGTVTAIDTLFVRDELPLHPHKDSTMGIRFVNLLDGNMSVSVNLQGQPDGSQLSSLGHKRYTAYQKYKIEPTGNNYVFEIRDANNGDLLISYPVNVNDLVDNTSISNRFRYRNFTLAIFGVPGSTGNYMPGAALIDNY